MTSLILASSLYAAILATGAETYAEAHQVTDTTGKPMVIMVGADWCGPCQNMKNRILPEIRHRGLLGRVAYGVVNVDREPELTSTLTGGGPIPQLVMYRKTPGGWRQRKLIGLQSVTQVEQFINEGLALDAATKAAEKANVGGPNPSDSKKVAVQPVSSH